MRSDHLHSRCSEAVLHLNNQLADCKNGSLIQVWLPEVGGNNRTVLSTKGLPYAVAGVGDLLALFRCISCRFSFSTDIMQPRLLGAIGRVYTTSEPEVCGDVQKYDKQIYLRVSEAQRCRVHSTVVIPFFEPAERHRALGVIEVVKNDKGVSFSRLLENVIAALESVSLCTSEIDLNQIEDGLKQWPADNDLHLFDIGYDLYPCSTSPIDLDAGNNANHSEPMISNPSEMDKASFFDAYNKYGFNQLGMAHHFVGANAVGLQMLDMIPRQETDHDLGRNHADLPQDSNRSHLFPHQATVGPLVDIGEGDVPGLIGMAQMNVGGSFHATTHGDRNNEQYLDKDRLDDLLHALSGNKFRKRRRGRMGRGRHLTYNDLQKYFGLRLEQAAAELGICKTTLKRACRRNGIPRWPKPSTRSAAGPDCSAVASSPPMSSTQDADRKSVV